MLSILFTDTFSVPRTWITVAQNIPSTLSTCKMRATVCVCIYASWAVKSKEIEEIEHKILVILEPEIYIEERIWNDENQSQPYKSVNMKINHPYFLVTWFQYHFLSSLEKVLNTTVRKKKIGTQSKKFISVIWLRQ